MEVQQERAQVIERWATWGAKRLGNWIGDRGQPVDLEFYDRLFYVGCVSALRCPEIGEGDFERWIYRTIWRETNFAYKTFVRRWHNFSEFLGEAKPESFDLTGQLEARSDLRLLQERLSTRDFQLLGLLVDTGSETAAAKELRERDRGRRALVTYRALLYSIRDRAREILDGK